MLLIANLVQFSFWWLLTKQSAGYVFMAQKANRQAKSAQVYLGGLLSNNTFNLYMYVLKCCHQTFNKLRPYIATIPGFTPYALIVENSSHAIVLELIAIWVPVLPV